MFGQYNVEKFSEIIVFFVDGQYFYIDGYEFINLIFVVEIRSLDLYIFDNIIVFFWYYMNGVGVGELRVVLVDWYGGIKIVWIKFGR